MLLLCAQSPVLQSHLASMTFSASTCRDRILASALEANFEVEPSMLGNLFLSCICNWHVVVLDAFKGYFLPFYCYAANMYNTTRSTTFP